MHAFWYGVIALLWAGFFVLEGFSLGAGALVPIVGRNDAGRAEAIATLAPAWDGNEAWLLAAGTATFFAYRGWFDGLLTGFTAWFVSIFLALFVRATAMNARGRVRTLRGRKVCDTLVFVSSVAPAFVLGLLFANFLRGVELDAGGSVRSEIMSDFSGYALLGAAAAVLLFVFQGAAFLSMHARGETQRSARLAMLVTGPLALTTTIGWLCWTETFRGGQLSRIIAAAITVGLVVAFVRSLAGHTYRAFAATVVSTLLLPLWVFSALWPDVLPDRTRPALSLTAHGTAASSGALTVLTIVGVEVGAVVLVYLTWSYWIFHARVTGRNRGDRALELAREHAPAANGRFPRRLMPPLHQLPRITATIPDRGREAAPSEV